MQYNRQLILPCTKRHAKIIRGITIGGAPAGPGNSGGGNENATSAPKLGDKKVTSAPPPVTAHAGTAASVAQAQTESAVSLRTVGKTVAFLAKLSAEGHGGEGSVSAFGAGKTGAGGGAGSAYG